MKLIKKIIKNIIEFMLGTLIIWLPILGIAIATKLSEIISMDMIATAFYIAIPILAIIIFIKD